MEVWGEKAYNCNWITIKNFFLKATATTTIKILWERIFPTWQLGTHFTRQILHQVCKTWPMLQHPYCIYNPQSFGFIFLIYFIDYAITVVPFPPSLPSTLHTPSHPVRPRFSSCPWVINMSSLASTFPILFLISPCLFSTYHSCYLFSVPFPPLSPSHSPADNPPYDLHFSDSVPVLIVCLVCFCFCFRCGC